MNATALVEDAVRKATANPDYKFGDLTKGAIKELSGKDVDEYQFGDISRRMAADAQEQLSGAVSGAVTGITGKEKYEFGDISRKFISDADGALASARDAYFDELPSALWRQLFAGLSDPQRRELIISLVQLFAACLLAYSLIFNLSIGGTISLAWGITSRQGGVSPLASAVAWSNFLQVHTSIRLFADPPLLPVRIFIATLIVPRYRRVLNAIQRALPLKGRQYVLNRAISVGVAWLLINVGAVAVMMALGIGLAGVLTGVPPCSLLGVLSLMGRVRGV